MAKKTYAVPLWVWERIADERLTGAALRVLAGLVLGARPTPGGWSCGSSLAQLAEASGLSLASVSRGLGELEDLGALRTVHRGRSGARRVLVDVPPL